MKQKRLLQVNNSVFEMLCIKPKICALHFCLLLTMKFNNKKKKILKNLFFSILAGGSLPLRVQTLVLVCF